MESIRSTLFASYNACPYKAKLQKENPRDWNQFFPIGTLVHDILADAPTYIEKGEEWESFFAKKIKDLEYVSPELVIRAKDAISNGFKNVSSALADGFEIQTEVPMERTLPCGIQITGKADRIDQSKKLFRIIDYKIGFVVPTKTELLGNFQLLVYSYLAQSMAKLNQEVEIGIYSLGRNILSSVVIPVDVECMIEEILNERAIKMQKDTTFRPNPSSLCGYCDYKYDCMAYKTMIEYAKIPKGLDEKIEFYDQLTSYKSGLDAVIKSVKEDIAADMVEQGLTEIEIGGKEKKLIQNVYMKGNDLVITRPYIKG